MFLFELVDLGRLIPYVLKREKGWHKDKEDERDQTKEYSHVHGGCRNFELSKAQAVLQQDDLRCVNEEVSRVLYPIPRARVPEDYIKDD